MVWRSTTKVGCAFSSTCHSDFASYGGFILTCEYDPPGNANLPGSLQEEVRPPTCAKGATRLSSRKGSRVAVSRAARAGRAMKRKIL